VLGDEAKRKEYDQVREMGPMGGAQFGGPGGFSGGPEGFGDLFSQMFGRGRGSNAGVGPQRGGDIEAQLTLSFEDAAHGLTTSLHLTAEAQCSSCAGSGARPGTTPKVCGSCGGRGSVANNQGFFSLSSPCTTCAGRGLIIEHACSTCRGSGVEVRPREVKVRIPAGVSDGQRIRLKGRGAPGRNGGPPGDLFVECRVMPHAVFGRDGLNLLVHVPVSFSEAALGATVSVPTLDGKEVSLRIKPGTASGSRHRVRGHGIATPSKTGDLIVTVDVHIPTSLNNEEQTALEALHKVLRSPRGTSTTDEKAGKR
jgi:molecular chaperone DnaJ